MWYSSAEGIIVASQLWGILGQSWALSFAYSPHVGLCRCPLCPMISSHLPKLASRWTDYSKFSVSLNDCVNVCMWCLAMDTCLIQGASCLPVCLGLTITVLTRMKQSLKINENIKSASCSKILLCSKSKIICAKQSFLESILHPFNYPEL